MYDRRQKVLVVSKLQSNSVIVGLIYKLYNASDMEFELEKGYFGDFFREYNVLNAELTSDFKIRHINGTPSIGVRKVVTPLRKHTSTIVGTSFPNYPIINLPKSGIVRLYHGTPKVVMHPKYGFGTGANDYGKGFYCTQEIELAKEWGAKKVGKDGYVCKYKINLDGLKILRLDSGSYRDLLTWMCILTDNRDIGYSGPLQQRNLQELHQYFGVTDYNNYDIIVGYRADDSYFSCVKSFINGGISLEKLGVAFKAGNLGNQVVIKSKKAFEALKYIGYEKIGSDKYKQYFDARDSFARGYFTRGIDNGKINFYSILDSERRKRGKK